MKRLLALTLSVVCLSLQAQIKTEDIAPGIVKLSIGTPERNTPYSFCKTLPDLKGMTALGDAELPFPIQDIILQVTSRGCEVSIPLNKSEQLYGFGLQIGSFQQRGLKKRLVVNDNPLNSLGYTHGPQTFYISTDGYGILVNTLRYTTFYCGTNTRLTNAVQAASISGQVSTSTEDLYKNEKAGSMVYVDIPNVEGVEVFVIKGHSMRDVVQRYNLFSGGGCLPPMWGLGFKYRTKSDFKQAGVERMSNYFREKEIPCDVLGLEPGWHTAAYSCSYVWNTERFPDHKSMLDNVRGKGYHINLWEHAYVNPKAPFWQEMKPYSGDFLVWNGLVPDFTLPRAREIFQAHHEKLLEEGISGFKLDECDNSNISSAEANWGFPDMSRFPSGMDGESMHQTFGVLYLQTLDEMYRKRNMRTYQDYRASGMFVSSIPATIYSDIYDHRDYVQMLCNSSFAGLLWSPEVRQSSNEYDFFHRLQTVLLSPHAVVDSWFLENAPWLQYDRAKNNRNEFLPNVEEMESNVRKQINLRMMLLPYLYSAFAAYHQQGIPPFRAMVLDYDNDPNVASICDQYMIGDILMAAPLFENSHRRTVYFPEGVWLNFNTNERYEGGREYEIETTFGQLPLYVKDNSILPLARPVQYCAESTVFDITCHVYGKPSRPVTLFEDDGVSYNFTDGQYNRVTLWVEKGKGKIKRAGNYKGVRYNIAKWQFRDL